MNRELAIKSIRPAINTTVEPSVDEAFAYFQLKTLRPILKFQHDFFIKIAIEKLVLKHKQWQAYEMKKKRELIASWVSLEVETKKIFEGAVIALMTMEELDFYLRNEKEVQKRIRALLIERLATGLEV